MDTFTLDWGRGWWARLTGGNPLVRTTDRVEAVCIVLAVTVLMAAVPVVAAFGTSMKDRRSAVYAQQALSRHATTATALADARLHVGVNSQIFDVKARWSAEDGIHVGTVRARDMARAGEHVETWIDDRRNYAGTVAPPSRAAAEAIGWSALSWMALVAGVIGALYAVRRRSRGVRYAEWEREIESLAGNGGGRTSHEPRYPDDHEG
jgi:hypothetical protein